MSSEWRLEGFVIVPECKQGSKVPSYSSNAGNQMHGYGVYVKDQERAILLPIYLGTIYCLKWFANRVGS